MASVAKGKETRKSCPVPSLQPRPAFLPPGPAPPELILLPGVPPRHPGGQLCGPLMPSPPAGGLCAPPRDPAVFDAHAVPTASW